MFSGKDGSARIKLRRVIRQSTATIRLDDIQVVNHVRRLSHSRNRECGANVSHVAASQIQWSSIAGGVILVRQQLATQAVPHPPWMNKFPLSLPRNHPVRPCLVGRHALGMSAGGLYHVADNLRLPRRSHLFQSLARFIIERSTI